MADDGFSVVLPARTTNFIKPGVQQLRQSLAIAANAGVMKLDLEGLEFLKQRGHGSSFCAA